MNDHHPQQHQQQHHKQHHQKQPHSLQPSSMSTLSDKDCWKLRQKSKCTSWYNSDEFLHVGQNLGKATGLFLSTTTVLEPTSTVVPAEEKTQQQQHQHRSSLSFNTDDDIIPHYHDISNAIQQVSIWRKRSNHNNNGRLPHSIEITSSLAECLLQDAQCAILQSNHFSGSSNNNDTSPMALRLSYASTIIRGVNGIADSISRNRGVQQYTNDNNNDTNNNSNSNTSSVASLCSKVGLPFWIVDIRHDASHSELPSLSMVRLAAITLLQFYIDKYWNLIKIQKEELKMNCFNYLCDWENYVMMLNNGNDNNNDDTEVDDQQLQSNGSDDEPNKRNKTDVSNDTMHGETKLNNTKKKKRKEKADKNKIQPYGAYSIFLEETKKKKSSSSSSSISSKQSSSVSLMKKKQKKKQKASTKKMQTQQLQTIMRKQDQCIQELLKYIPMDVAYDALLSYFIWGGVVDLPQYCGILICCCGSTDTIQQKQQQERQQESLRIVIERYGHTLLPQICKTWPGFLVSLVINLVDFIFLLEDHRSSYNHNEKNNDDRDSTISSSSKHSEETNICDDDVIIEQKLLYSFSWVKYLFSNECYHRLGWIKNDEIQQLTDAALSPLSPSSLSSSSSIAKHRKKNQKVSTNGSKSTNVLELNASLSVLKMAQFPLNSLCDRCIERINSACIGVGDSIIMSQHENPCNVTSYSGKIASLLLEILKDERIAFHGIAELQNDNHPCSDDDKKMKKRKIKESQSPKERKCNDKRRNTNTAQHDDDLQAIYDVNRSMEHEGEMNQSIMNLDDMEALLSDEHNDDRAVNVDIKQNGNECSTNEVQEFGSGGRNNNDQRNNCISIINPWTLCSSWDPCPIGTLPGHVS
jgi:hypothetical protein